MTSTSQDRKHAPKIDSRQAASDLFDWLEQGGGSPDILPGLAPRQYEEVLGKIRERIIVFARTRNVTLNPGALEALLDVATRMPATRAGTQARAVAVKFALDSDPSGAVAISTLAKVLVDASLGAADAEFFIRQSGSLAVVISGLASAWTEATEDRRPTSGETTALARLISAELTAAGNEKYLDGSSRAALLRNLATSLRSVRVRDHSGARDPLLQGIASACDAAADSLSAPVPEPVQPASPPAAVTAGVRRERMVSELRTLCDDFQMEIEKFNAMEDEARAVHTEVHALRRERDDLTHTIADLRATIDRLNDEIRRLTVALGDSGTKIAQAEAIEARWRAEADQARREAENATREKVSKAGRDVDKMMERYLAPVLMIIEQGSIGTDDIEPIKVNLLNLQQKVKALTERMGSNSAGPEGGTLLRTDD
jgi:uncharacterized coiled-coil protein SlyX